MTNASVFFFFANYLFLQIFHGWHLLSSYFFASAVKCYQHVRVILQTGMKMSYFFWCYWLSGVLSDESRTWVAVGELRRKGEGVVYQVPQ